MSALLAALLSFLRTNSVLTTLAGVGFNVRVSEVWNLPSSVVYPILALNLERKPDPVRGAPVSAYILRCWYITNGSMSEAFRMRDALKNLLHLQAQSLTAAGVPLQWCELIASKVNIAPDINKHEAFLDFDLVS